MDGIIGAQNVIGIFLSIIEGAEVIVNSMDVDVWEAKYKRTGAFTDGVGSYNWLCL